VADRGTKTRVPDPVQYWPVPRSSTVLVYSHDRAALQVIRDFLEPLGYKVEVAPAAPDINSLRNWCPRPAWTLVN